MRYQADPSSRRSWSWLESGALLLLVVVGLITLGLWKLQRVQLLSVQSPSMAPALQPGDAVVVEPLNDLPKIGEIVTYRSLADPKVLITHRVVKVEGAGLITTKGDGLDQVDPRFPRRQIVGVVSYHVTKLGYVVDFLRSPVNLLASIYLPAVWVVVSELRRLQNFYSQAKYQAS